MRKLIFFLIMFIFLNVFSISMSAKYLTETGAGSKDGTSWDNAYDLAAFEAYIEGLPSDTFYHSVFIKAGTYTLTDDIIKVTGNFFYPEFIGVKSATTAEPPTESDFSLVDGERPVFVIGEYVFNPAVNFNKCIGINFTGQTDLLVKDNPNYYFCKFINNSETADRRAVSTNKTIMNCDMSSTNGYAVGAYRSSIVDSYIHDSKYSFYQATNSAIVGCIIYNITGTSNPVTLTTSIVYGCTFYDIANIAINNGYMYGVGATKNIFKSCQQAFIQASDWRAPYRAVHSGSTFYDITSASDGLYVGCDTTDPNFEDTSTLDFSPQTTTQAYPTTFNGTTTPNYSIAGAAQLDGSATGGSSEHSYISVN